MVQVKKVEVRSAILKSARNLYSKDGYVNTSMNAVARDAQISTANLYNYFDSKLEILYEVYEPWLIEHVRKIENGIEKIEDPTQRFRFLLNYIWKEMPASDKGFANNLIQALSSLHSDDKYHRELLIWFEEKITQLLEPTVKSEYKKFISNNALSHLITMTFDGYVMNYRLTKSQDNTYGADRVDDVIQIFTEIFAKSIEKPNK